MDQVNVAKVRLAGIGGNARAMLYSSTQMSITFDAQTLHNSDF